MSSPLSRVCSATLPQSEEQAAAVSETPSLEKLYPGVTKNLDDALDQERELIPHPRWSDKVQPIKYTVRELKTAIEEYFTDAELHIGGTSSLTYLGEYDNPNDLDVIALLQKKDVDNFFPFLIYFFDAKQNYVLTPSAIQSIYFPPEQGKIFISGVLSWRRLGFVEIEAIPIENGPPQFSTADGFLLSSKEEKEDPQLSYIQHAYYQGMDYASVMNLKLKHHREKILHVLDPKNARRLTLRTLKYIQRGFVFGTKDLISSCNREQATKTAGEFARELDSTCKGHYKSFKTRFHLCLNYCSLFKKMPVTEKNMHFQKLILDKMQSLDAGDLASPEKGLKDLFLNYSLKAEQVFSLLEVYKGLLYFRSFDPSTSVQAHKIGTLSERPYLSVEDEGKPHFLMIEETAVDQVKVLFQALHELDKSLKNLPFACTEDLLSWVNTMTGMQLESLDGLQEHLQLVLLREIQSETFTPQIRYALLNFLSGNANPLSSKLDLDLQSQSYCVLNLERLGEYMPVIRKLLKSTDPIDEEEESLIRAAIKEMGNGNVSHGTQLLIYKSLFERRPSPELIREIQGLRKYACFQSERDNLIARVTAYQTQDQAAAKAAYEEQEVRHQCALDLQRALGQSRLNPKMKEQFQKRGCEIGNTLLAFKYLCSNLEEEELDPNVCIQMWKGSYIHTRHLSNNCLRDFLLICRLPKSQAKVLSHILKEHLSKEIDRQNPPRPETVIEALKVLHKFSPEDCLLILPRYTKLLAPEYRSLWGDVNFAEIQTQIVSENGIRHFPCSVILQTCMLFSKEQMAALKFTPKFEGYMVSRWIDSVLEKNEDVALFNQFFLLFLASNHPSSKAFVLYCLGRLEHDGHESVQEEIKGVSMRLLDFLGRDPKTIQLYLRIAHSLSQHHNVQVAPEMACKALLRAKDCLSLSNDLLFLLSSLEDYAPAAALLDEQYELFLNSDFPLRDEDLSHIVRHLLAKIGGTKTFSESAMKRLHYCLKKHETILETTDLQIFQEQVLALAEQSRATKILQTLFEMGAVPTEKKKGSFDLVCKEAKDHPADKIYARALRCLDYFDAEQLADVDAVQLVKGALDQHSSQEQSLPHPEAERMLGILERKDNQSKDCLACLSRLRTSELQDRVATLTLAVLKGKKGSKETYEALHWLITNELKLPVNRETFTLLLESLQTSPYIRSLEDRKNTLLTLLSLASKLEGFTEEDSRVVIERVCSFYQKKSDEALSVQASLSKPLALFIRSSGLSIESLLDLKAYMPFVINLGASGYARESNERLLVKDTLDALIKDDSKTTVVVELLSALSEANLQEASQWKKLVHIWQETSESSPFSLKVRKVLLDSFQRGQVALSNKDDLTSLFQCGELLCERAKEGDKSFEKAFTETVLKSSLDCLNGSSGEVLTVLRIFNRALPIESDKLESFLQALSRKQFEGPEGQEIARLALPLCTAIPLKLRKEMMNVSKPRHPCMIAAYLEVIVSDQQYRSQHAQAFNRLGTEILGNSNTDPKLARSIILLFLENFSLMEESGKAALGSDFSMAFFSCLDQVFGVTERIDPELSASLLDFGFFSAVNTNLAGASEITSLAKMAAKNKLDLSGFNSCIHGLRICSQSAAAIKVPEVQQLIFELLELAVSRPEFDAKRVFDVYQEVFRAFLDHVPPTAYFSLFGALALFHGSTSPAYLKDVPVSYIEVIEETLVIEEYVTSSHVLILEMVEKVMLTEDTATISHMAESLCTLERSFLGDDFMSIFLRVGDFLLTHYEQKSTLAILAIQSKIFPPEEVPVLLEERIALVNRGFNLFLGEQVDQCRFLLLKNTYHFLANNLVFVKDPRHPSEWRRLMMDRLIDEMSKEVNSAVGAINWETSRSKLVFDELKYYFAEELKQEMPDLTRIKTYSEIFEVFIHKDDSSVDRDFLMDLPVFLKTIIGTEGKITPAKEQVLMMYEGIYQNIIQKRDTKELTKIAKIMVQSMASCMRFRRLHKLSIVQLQSSCNEIHIFVPDVDLGVHLSDTGEVLTNPGGIALRLDGSGVKGVVYN
jgi:hypothetical protein